ncbi:acyl-CoA dehydrogenase family protein [Arthrobacter sp. H14-L1]|uniref:acyl-CoA dehydrogenase family protein n=1 Tax=Arthrobacter sp. H14-L1 TaxID=2996697 RepID=UPI00226E2886|nr:acyl-CoA dehydrogenase family protein [Arthrobacter sp. H14-L1]MCY0904517.1 acyl-CoA dehydrogenase [Arthrobacter sp. H14-L1]
MNGSEQPFSEQPNSGHPSMQPVRLAPESDSSAPWLPELRTIAARALECAGGIEPALALAIRLGQELPYPMEGRTLQLWESLATVGACNLSVGRTIEPHLDAVSILHQARQQSPSEELQALAVAEKSCWGVFAAEGRDHNLRAHRHGNGWVLTGTKPWCSLAGRLTHAIVTARTDNARRAFAVNLKDPGVSAAAAGWVALGLPDVASGPVSFEQVPAVPVGAPGWYLDRPGFAWGGTGVAALWFGAATAVARRVYAHCAGREPDQIAMLQLGLVDGHLTAARTALALAARQADSGGHPGSVSLSAARARAAVVHASESILELASHAMGPEPLAFDADHAARVADLTVYLRQDHAERSIAAIGQQLLAPGRLPW